MARNSARFLLHLGPFADIIPIPFPLIQNVASIGDVFLTAGLALFLFASIVRVPNDLDDAAASRIRSSLGTSTTAESGLSPAFAASAALERQVVLGGRRGGLASPARTTIPARPVEVAERIRRHPYVRLALNGSFSALWVGQLISLFGDRIHQVALTALVYATTGSPVAAGLSFFFAALPNLFLSPLAGTFVDRWDRKEVLIVSDILRAAVVLLIPIAAIVNVVLVYPLIFLVTSISIFFRPARVAILPQLVEDDELVTANSALWIGETIADVLSFPIAGLFVVFLGSALPLAFWLDAATYLASAVLLAIDRGPTGQGAHGRRAGGRRQRPGAADDRVPRASSRPVGDSCAATSRSSPTRSRPRWRSSRSGCSSPSRRSGRSRSSAMRRSAGKAPGGSSRRAPPPATSSAGSPSAWSARGSSRAG